MVAEPPESWFSSLFLWSRVEAPVASPSFPDVLENSSSPRGPAATQTSGSSRTNEQNSSRMEKNLNNSRWRAAEVALNSHDGHFAEIEIVFLIKKHADQPLALARRRLSLPAAGLRSHLGSPQPPSTGLKTSGCLKMLSKDRRQEEGKKEAMWERAHSLQRGRNGVGIAKRRHLPMWAREWRGEAPGRVGRPGDNFWQEQCHGTSQSSCVKSHREPLL